MASRRRARRPAARVALVHDWLTGMRGGEKVLEVLCERFPDADLFTLRPRAAARCRRRSSGAPIRTSFVQRLPGVAPLLPPLPAALSRPPIEQFDLDGFDLVISTSHCAAKAVVAAGRRAGTSATATRRCATPGTSSTPTSARTGSGRLRQRGCCGRCMARLARWDRDTAGRVDRYVAISQYVAGRIRRYYNREATVVYPPVDTDFFTPGRRAARARIALVVSALVPYKRIDLAIDACRRAGVPAEDRRRRARARARSSARPAGATSSSSAGVDDDDVRDALPPRRGRAAAGRGGLRHRAASRRRPAAGRSSRSAAAARSRPSSDGETGVLVDDADAPRRSPTAMRRAVDAAVRRARPSARHAERFGRARFGDEIDARRRRRAAPRATRW